MLKNKDVHSPNDIEKEIYYNIRKFWNVRACSLCKFENESSRFGFSKEVINNNLKDVDVFMKTYLI